MFILYIFFYSLTYSRLLCQLFFHFPLSFSLSHTSISFLSFFRLLWLFSVFLYLFLSLPIFLSTLSSFSFPMSSTSVSNMVLILDSNSEIGVHVRYDNDYLIYLRHLFKSGAVTSHIFFSLSVFLSSRSLSELFPLLLWKLDKNMLLYVQEVLSIFIKGVAQEVLSIFI